MGMTTWIDMDSVAHFGVYSLALESCQREEAQRQGLRVLESNNVAHQVGVTLDCVMLWPPFLTDPEVASPLSAVVTVVIDWEEGYSPRDHIIIIIYSHEQRERTGP